MSVQPLPALTVTSKLLYMTPDFLKRNKILPKSYVFLKKHRRKSFS